MNKAWNVVKQKLELRWSPGQIAKWLKMEYLSHRMSDKTIQNHVFFHIKAELKKVALLELPLIPGAKDPKSAALFVVKKLR